jgi:hypothetical protein
MGDTDDFDVDTPYLRMRLDFLVPGPQVTSEEKRWLTQLCNVVEQIGLKIFESRDPDGYALWEANHPGDDDDDDDNDGEDDDEDEEDEPMEAKVIPFRKSGS